MESTQQTFTQNMSDRSFDRHKAPPQVRVDLKKPKKGKKGKKRKELLAKTQRMTDLDSTIFVGFSSENCLAN